MTTARAYCLLFRIQGKDEPEAIRVGGAFPVDAEDIADLREKVKERKPNVITGFDPDHLVVWRCPNHLADRTSDQQDEFFREIDFKKKEKIVQLTVVRMIRQLGLGSDEALLVQLPDLNCIPPAVAPPSPAVPASRQLPDDYFEGQGSVPRRKRPRTVSDSFACPEEASACWCKQESEIATDRLYEEVYKKAWGVPWPHRMQREIRLGHEVMGEGQVTGQAGSESVVALGGEEIWKYTCLSGVKVLGSLLGMTTDVRRALVIRDEYKWIRNTIQKEIEETRPEESDIPSFVLLGQPGIGKTTFLLYLLLYRLEHRLPTAIQVVKERYTIFDEGGVVICNADGGSSRLTPECWMLCDSNSVVIQPCSAFLCVGGGPLIQATSAKQERWKGWVKHKMAKKIVVDLPGALEIAAIAREDGHDPSKAIEIMRTWGPCIRTVIHTLNQKNDHGYEESARLTALAIAQNPVSFLNADAENLDSKCSPVLFLCPYREPNPRYNNRVLLDAHMLQIPTPELGRLLDEARARISNEQALTLFSALSSHSLTRSAAGWKHETQMHVCMSRGGEAKELLPCGQIQPVTRLLPGILASLKTVGGCPSFYWVPSISNFEGIDAVLGYQGSIYTLQATISIEHSSPKEGLRKVWSLIDPVARGWKWHFVIVSNEAVYGLHLRDKFLGEGGLTLRSGNQTVPVDIFVCVI